MLRRVQVEPTNSCNFSCGFCRRTHWSRPTGEMSLSQFRVILKKLPKFPYLHLQGVGEPLLNSDLSDMVALARACEIEVGTTTNASLLTEERAAELFDAGISRINISVDTNDAELFAQTRPGHSLESVLKNIAALAEVRRSFKRYESVLALGVVAKQSTIKDLPGVIHLAVEYGFEEVFVQNLNASFLSEEFIKEETFRDTEQQGFSAAVVEAQKIAADHGITFLPPVFESTGYGQSCNWPFKGCNITWDGYVSPCCLQPDPEILSFGNIFENDFEEIWSSAAYNSFREEFVNGDAQICLACPALNGQMWHPQAAPL